MPRSPLIPAKRPVLSPRYNAMDTFYRCARSFRVTLLWFFFFVRSLAFVSCSFLTSSSLFPCHRNSRYGEMCWDFYGVSSCGFLAMRRWEEVIKEIGMVLRELLELSYTPFAVGQSYNMFMLYVSLCRDWL